MLEKQENEIRKNAVSTHLTELRNKTPIDRQTRQTQPVSLGVSEQGVRKIKLVLGVNIKRFSPLRYQYSPV